MNHRTALYVIAANLLALAALSFVYPQLMIAPGPLSEGHRRLETDCFACHAAFRGATADRCIACHKVADIGRVTTTGQAVTGGKLRVPFHQQLVKQDCLACHSDHRGVAPFRPTGRFSHGLIAAEARERCEACHAKPADSLHAKIAGNCRQCHEQERWKPATFAHEKYFVLDSDHAVACATCHPNSDFSRYTCYGCHEHSPARIQAEHAEEGIRNLDDCVECHRSGEREGGARRERD